MKRVFTFSTMPFIERSPSVVVHDVCSGDKSVFDRLDFEFK